PPGRGRGGRGAGPVPGRRWRVLADRGVVAGEYDVGGLGGLRSGRGAGGGGACRAAEEGEGRCGRGAQGEPGARGTASGRSTRSTSNGGCMVEVPSLNGAAPSICAAGR